MPSLIFCKMNTLIDLNVAYQAIGYRNAIAVGVTSPLLICASYFLLWFMCEFILSMHYSISTFQKTDV